MDKKFPTIVCQMEEDEGGRDQRSGKKRGGYRRGASAVCLCLYISPGFGNQTQEKPTASKHSGGLACITYFPAAQTFNDDSPPFVYVVFFFSFFFFFPPSEAVGWYLDLPGQLAECGECARLPRSVSI